MELDRQVDEDREWKAEVRQIEGRDREREREREGEREREKMLREWKLK